jgi:predicted HD phosphohydrolase
MERAAQILGEPLFALFNELPRNERRHGLDVLNTVLIQEASLEPLLLQAALLHDMGKASARFSVMDRSLAVFLERVAPAAIGLLERLLPDFAHRYRAYRDHPKTAAAVLRKMGAEELSAVVAEHHVANPSLEVTRRLQRADQLN